MTQKIELQNLESHLTTPTMTASTKEPPQTTQELLPTTTPTTTQKNHKLTLIPLIFLIYFEVAGGPYGEEPAVKAAGPLLAILGFLVFPFIWSVPEAIITAELSTTFPGEVENPRKTFPLALFSSVVFTCLGYIIPLMAVTGAIAVDQRDWDTGFMANAAEMISGRWLKFWIEIGAVLSAIGLFEAQLSSSAFQILGMAEIGFLPKFFGLRSKWFNTPWVGIVLSTSISLGMSYMDFQDIISSANFLYSLGMLLEFASFLWLRRKFPLIKRPYRVPMRLPLLVIMCLIPCGFLVFIMVIAKKLVYLISGLMTIGGIGWYFLMNFCKSKKLLKYNSKVDDIYEE
ncbi:hypothetical protein P3S68_001392 [Capsicum galapagoense]